MHLLQDGMNLHVTVISNKIYLPLENFITVNLVREVTFIHHMQRSNGCHKLYWQKRMMGLALGNLGNRI